MNALKILPLILVFFTYTKIVEAKEVVIVGDSLTCGSFGDSLLQNLSAQGNNVTIYCAVSSQPANWLNGTPPSHFPCFTKSTSQPKNQLCPNQNINLDQIIKAHPGSQFIAALGTNNLDSKSKLSAYSKMAEKLAAAGSCKWIGPPHLQPSTKSTAFPKSRLQSLESNLNTFYDQSLLPAIENDKQKLCDLVDSRDATLPGTNGNSTEDGIHRDARGGKYWADHIMKQLDDGTSSPTTTPNYPSTADVNAQADQILEGMNYVAPTNYKSAPSHKKKKPVYHQPTPTAPSKPIQSDELHDPASESGGASA